MRAFVELADGCGRAIMSKGKYRRFRYGVQVNSVDQTAARKQRLPYSIGNACSHAFEKMLAHVRAVQLPAWNEALGLPRPWDQQWSLRSQF
jgi:methylmalonyl-CoA mutase N-terminal domain/subunit